MTWDEWIDKNERALNRDKTPWELEFVNEILREVPNLTPDVVSAQTPFDDLHGKQRFIDFTIEEGDSVRIALEVDGYDKDGTGRGQTRSQFKDWSFRELSMTAEGWIPMRFANGLITDMPEDLRRSIELLLKLQRPNEPLSGPEKSEFDQLRDRIEKENERLEKENERLRKENWKMKLLYALLALVALAAIGTIAFLLLNDDDGPPICAEAKPAGDLSTADEGKNAKVKGEVAQVSRPSTGPSRVYLNLGDEFPEQELAVVIWGDKIENWNTPPEDKYDNREVAISGVIDVYDGDLQIEANSPNDVVICP